jgi:quinol-cytochrome oxidoreductase complex cytochrome b subunit
MSERGDGDGRRLRQNELYRAVFHPGERFKRSELYRSAIRHPRPNTPRGRAMTSFHNFFLHLYPVKVPRKVLSFRSTFRLGFISTVLFLILFVSGMYLMFFYHPAVPEAYFDMHKLATQVTFGQFVRNMHRWAAHLMVIVVFLHLLRVFYAGAYKAPRQFNWLIGVALLIFTLLFSFTGYLLPWDQLAYWAVTVGTSIAGYVPFLGNKAQQVLLGGSEIGSETLIRFYVLHIYVLPAALILFLCVHIWRIRKDGFQVADREQAEPWTEPIPAEEPSAAEEVTADA